MSIRGGSSYSYVSEYTISAGEANTDVLRSVTIPGPTIGTWTTVTLSFGLVTGANYQHAPNAWLSGDSQGSPNQFNFMGTVNNVFELFDFGMYEGNVAPPFMVPDYESEWVACRRYYNKIVNPAATAQGNGSTVLSYVNIPFPVPMRVTPTVSLVGNISFGNATSAPPAISVNAAIWGGSDNIVVNLNSNGTAPNGTYSTSGSAGAFVLNARL